MYKLATILAVGLVLAVGLGQSASNKRAYVSGKFGLELDGVAAGLLRSCDGGAIDSDVVTEDPVNGVVKKHIGGVKYEDITVTCGTGMSKAMYEWIKASFDHTYARKNGALIAANYDYKELSRLSFYNALVTEIGMPALDAGSKDAAKMTIKFKPELTRQSPGTGLQVPSPKVQKLWLPANFRLKIDGLDEPCSRVNKIEALVVKQKVVENPVGELRDYEVPNLVITFPESVAQPFYEWHEDFVIKGNNGDDKEKGGTLDYLTPDLKEVLFSLTFSHLGIYKLTPEKVESGSESIRRVKAEMYCEEMSFNYGDTVWN
jgi:phage tail-like protein